MTTFPHILWLLLDFRTVLLFAFLLVVLRLFVRHPKNLPPGPWEFPVIGSLPAIVREVRRGGELHHLCRKYAAEYGSVFRVRLFNKTLVILNDYASVKEAFQHPQLNGRPETGTNGVSGTSGETWVELRRFCLTVLRGFGVGKSSFEKKIGTEGEELLKEMAACNGKPFNPKPLLGCAVSNVICSVVLGKRYEYTDQEFTRLLDALSSVVRGQGPGGALFFFPILRVLSLLTPSVYHVIFTFNQIAKFLNNSIDAHRAELDPVNPNDFIDAYLIEVQRNLSKDEAGTPTNGSSSKTKNLSEKNILCTIADLFAGGSETTATTLEWCILYMTVYPEIQRRVQAEIDEVVGRNRLPRLADKPQLNLTRAVIWEIQRVANIVPLGVFHAAASDTQFRGFLIPKGAFLVSNLWQISRDPKLWPQPEKFKPERFLDDEGKAFRPDEFIPFGTGRRICIGEHLAKMELFIFFSYFMHQFTFKKPDNSPPLTLRGKTGLTFSPPPFDICAIRRE